MTPKSTRKSWILRNGVPPWGYALRVSTPHVAL